jgi:hypothetical protein
MLGKNLRSRGDCWVAVDPGARCSVCRTSIGCARGLWDCGSRCCDARGGMSDACRTLTTFCDSGMDV